MSRIPSHAILVLLCIIFSAQVSFAVEREQVVSLKKGWNAVYLEVDPVIEQQSLSSFLMPPESSTPIQIIATYYPNFSSVEFISDPNEADWKKPSWNKWVRDDLPDAFLSNLYDLEAGRGYLIKSEADFEWIIKGEVEQLKTRWQPGTFNFVGFQVQENGPSFHQLFAGNTTAAALQAGPIFRLVKGQWEKVSLPDATVGKGEAYWVFANGMAEFQGGLSIEVQGGKNIVDFSETTVNQTLTLTNTTANPITAQLSLVSNEIPISLKSFATSDVEGEESYQTTYTPVTDAITTVSLEAGASEVVTLSVRRAEITETAEQTGLIRVTVSETYEEFWLPISANGVDE